MKKKNVLRLLAFVMAASLTLTSAPAGLLSGTETVYAEQKASDALTLGNVTYTSNSISVAEAIATTDKQFLLIEAGSGDTPAKALDADWITGLSGSDTRLSLHCKAGGSNDNEVDDAVSGSQYLKANTKYYIYWRYTGTTAVSDPLEVTTSKISLKDAIVTIEGETTTAKTGEYDQSDYSVVYKGKEWKPTVTKVQLAYDQDGDGTNDILSKDDLSQLKPEYKNNVNVGDKGDADGVAPTVIVTGKGDFEGSAYVKFSITAYDLDANAAKVRVLVDGNENGGKNKFTYKYTGLQINPTIEIQAQLDPDSTEYTTLKKGTEFYIDVDASYNSNGTDEKAVTSTTISDNKINYNIDVGTVTAKLVGTGNFTGGAEGTYEIIKSTPTAPAAPSIKDVTSKGFTIDTSNEDLKYSYQYMIVEEESTNYQFPDVKPDTPGAYDYDHDDIQNDGIIVSWLGDGNQFTKSNITVEYDSEQSETYLNGDTYAAIPVMGNSSAKLKLLAGHTYYVVCRIIADGNTTQSSISKATKVTLLPKDINEEVASTIGYTVSEIKKKGVAVTPESDGELKAFNKTYNGKAQDEVQVTLYDDTSANEVLSPSTYTVKYYNDLGDSANINDTNAWYKGKADDTTSAGKVYVYAVGDNKTYSGYYLIGYYTISKKTVDAVVNSTTKVYDGTKSVTLTADVKAELEGSDSVHVEGLTGTMAYAVVTSGGQKITNVSDTYAAISGTGSNNYTLRYDYSDTRVTVTKATVTIGGGSSVTAVFGKTIYLADTYKTGVAEVDAALKYNISDSTKTAGFLTLDEDDGTLLLKNYDALKNVKGITIKISYDPTLDLETDNYVISDQAGKTISVSLAKATTKLVFANDKVELDTDPYDTTTNCGYIYTVDQQEVYFPSYTRPAAIREVVENGGKSSSCDNVAGIETERAYVSDYPWSEYWKVENPFNGVDASNTPTDYGTKKDLDVTYKYYTASGKELDTIPYLDGTYYVKAYVAVDDVTYAGSSANIDDSGVAGTLKLVIGSGKSNAADSDDTLENDEEITEESRSLGYKIVDGKIYTVKDDKLIRSEFVEIDGVTYYANKNGVMVHGKTFKAVDGYWHYAHEDGSVETTKGIKATDDNGKVYCTGTNNGKLLVNGSKVVSGERYVANSKGKLVKKGFFTTKKGYTYYLTNYKAIKNKAFTDTDGKTYVANKNGTIQKGKKIVTVNGKSYYVGAKGVVAKNKVVTVSGKKYVANAKGVIVKNGKYTIGKKTYTTNKKGVITKTTTKK